MENTFLEAQSEVGYRALIATEAAYLNDMSDSIDASTWRAVGGELWASEDLCHNSSTNHE